MQSGEEADAESVGTPLVLGRTKTELQVCEDLRS